VVGDVNTDELKAAVARLEEDWKNLQTLAKKVEAKLEKKNFGKLTQKPLANA
jgi:predicted Zn-dependent peptidase